MVNVAFRRLGRFGGDCWSRDRWIDWCQCRDALSRLCALSVYRRTCRPFDDWGIFLALPLVTLRAEHVRVLIIVSYLPDHVSRWVSVLAGLLGLAFCLWFFALCLPWLEFAFDRTIKTEVGRLLMYPWMALLPLSMLLTGLAFLLRGLIAGNGTT